MIRCKADLCSSVPFAWPAQNLLTGDANPFRPGRHPPAASLPTSGDDMPYDLILRGGRVVDPSQKLDAVTDVAFAAGKVAAVGSGLKADPGTEVRDASRYIVTPGLIDLHTHVYWGGTSLGIDEIGRAHV